MDPSPATPMTDLNWSHVGLGLSFITFNIVISHGLQLRLGASLGIAALRCTVQLTLVATILQRVFAAKKWWMVAMLALVLITLGTFEAVVIKATRRCRDMFPSVLIAMLVANLPVAILGIRFAMGVRTFWTPEQFIPILGMLCGNSITGIVVSQSHILRELEENRDKTETLLAFGASRLEACRPLAVEALRIALLPTINMMSVMGIISIPGMMTGAILGGASVQQAARLQMVIMFMISASSAFSCTIATFFTLGVCIDSEHRIRSDRIDARPLAFRNIGRETFWATVGAAQRTWKLVKRKTKQGMDGDVVVGNGNGHGIHSQSERTPLLA